jgi:DNA repair protein SbcD/Mre11
LSALDPGVEARVRFLHTSDWHLGRSFFGASLLEDQAHVLDHLVTLAAESRIDAVLLAGDVYDRSVPPADAVRLLDDTLTRLVVGHGIPVVLIAGNHDSGERLGFASRLLTERGLYVAGTQPLVVRLGDAHGAVEIVALPFAEPAATAARCEDDSISDHDAALRADLARCLAGAALETFANPEARGNGESHRGGSGAPAGRGNGESHRGGSGAPGRGNGAPEARGNGASASSDRARRRVAVAHAFVSGGSTSESERPLVLGNAALVAAEVFDGFAYAALGHLHRPQRVGRDEVRYCGSLLKYSFDEASHKKSVSIVELAADGSTKIEAVALDTRRDVRVLEGSLEAVISQAAADGAREDYVLVRLTDRGAVMDAMGKMRAVYPNCLHIRPDESLASRNSSEERVDVRRHTETEMFGAFFREVSGEDANDDERRAFTDALTAVRRQGDGAA